MIKHNQSTHGTTTDTTSLLPQLAELGWSSGSGHAPRAPLPDKWAKAVSGLWSTAADWKSGVPAATSNVEIAVAAKPHKSYTVTIGTAAEAATVTLSAAAATLDDQAGLTIGTLLSITAGTFVLDGGVLSGGLIDVASTGTFAAGGGGTLANTVFEGSILDQYVLTIGAGVTWEGAGGSGSATITTENTTTISVLGDQTLNNLTIDFTAFGTLESTPVGGSPSTLTLGSNVTINSTGGFDILDNPVASGNTLINDGLINIEAGGEIIVVDANLVNNGTIDVDAGGTLTITGTATGNSVTTLVQSSTDLGGSYTLEGADITGGTLVGTYLAISDLFSPSLPDVFNDVAFQGSLIIGQSDYLNGLQELVIGAGTSFAGAGGAGAASIEMVTGALQFDAGTALNNVTVTLGSAGTAIGGTIETGGTASGAETLIIGASTVINAYGGALTVGTNGTLDQVVNEGQINVLKGLSIDLAGFVNDGSIIVDTGAILTFGGSNATGVAPGPGTFTAASVQSMLDTVVNDGGVVQFYGQIMPGTIDGDLSLSGTLSGVTFEGTLDATGPSDFDSATTFAGAGGVGQATINLAGTSLTALDDTTLDNAVINTSTFDFESAGLGGKETFTLGANTVVNVLSGELTLSGSSGEVLNGVINANAAGDYVLNYGAGTNNGTIDVTNGSTFTEAGSPSFVNEGSMTIQNSILSFWNGSMTNGSSGTLTLEASAGSTTSVMGTNATTGTLTNEGSLIILGGTVAISSALINSGTIGAGAGTMRFIGAVTNNGVLTETGGTSTFTASVAGSGTLNVAGGGVLALLAGAASTETLGFLDGTGTVDLSLPTHFLGAISGFGAGDQIDLINTAETSYSFSAGVLTIRDGTTKVASLHFDGSYTTGSFTVQSDTHGGSLITFH